METGLMENRKIKCMSFSFWSFSWHQEYFVVYYLIMQYIKSKIRTSVLKKKFYSSFMQHFNVGKFHLKKGNILNKKLRKSIFFPPMTATCI